MGGCGSKSAMPQESRQKPPEKKEEKKPIESVDKSMPAAPVETGGQDEGLVEVQLKPNGTTTTKRVQEASQQPEVQPEAVDHNLEKGHKLFSDGQYDQALSWYTKLFEDMLTSKGRDDAKLDNLMLLRSRCQLKLEHYDEAKKLSEDALASRIQEKGAHSLNAAECHVEVAKSHFALEDCQKALEHATLAHSILVKSVGKDEIVTANAAIVLGKVKAAMGATDEAIVLFRHALETQERFLPDDDLALASTIYEFCKLLLVHKDYERAARHSKRAYVIRTKLLPPTHKDMAECAVVDAELLCFSGQTTQAIARLEEALELQKKAGSSQAEIAETHRILGDVYIARSDNEAAVENYERARTIYKKTPHCKLAMSGVLFALGHIFLSPSESEAVTYETAQSSLQTSLDLRQKLLGPLSPLTLRTQIVLGEILSRHGDKQAALTFFQSVADAHNTSDEAIANHMNRGDALQNIGMLAFDDKDYSRALVVLQQALPIYEQNLGPNSMDVAAVAFNMAICASNLHDDAAATGYFAQSLKIRHHQLEKSKTSKSPTEADIAASRQNELEIASISFRVAAIHRKNRDVRKAIPLLGECLDIRARILGETDPLTTTAAFELGNSHRTANEAKQALVYLERARSGIAAAKEVSVEDLAVVLTAMAEVSMEEHEVDTAIKYYEEVAKIRVDTNNSVLLGNTYHNLGVLYGQKGDHLKSAEYHRKAATNRRRKSSLNGEDYTSIIHAGVSHLQAKDYEMGIQDLKKGLELQRSVLSDTNPSTVKTMLILGDAYNEIHKFEEAVGMFDRALTAQLEMEGKGVGVELSDITKTRMKLATAAKEIGNFNKALDNFRLVLEHYEKSKVDSSQIGKASYLLAEVLRELNEAELALAMYEKAAAIWEKNLGETHMDVGSITYTIAEIYEASQDFPAACLWYEKCVKAWEVSLEKDHPNLAAAVFNHANCLHANKKYEAAGKGYERANKIYTALYGKQDDRTKRAAELAQLMKWKEE